MSNYACVCQKPDTFKVIDQQIQKIIEQRPQAADSTFGSAVDHLTTVYASLKSLLTALQLLPIIPENWRKGIALFTAALDAVIASASAEFKAGKDL